MAHGLTKNSLAFPFAPGENWTTTTDFIKGVHEGIDWGCARGTPIYAVADGTVNEIVNDQHIGRYDEEDKSRKANGNFVRINSKRGDQDGFQHVYLHLLPGSIQVQPGDRVQAYQLLGLSGNTGNTKGPHLHLQLKELSGGKYENSFSFKEFLDDSMVKTEKDAHQNPELQTGQAITLKNTPETTGTKLSVSTQPGIWYDIVGRYEEIASASSWWQIVVLNKSNDREDVGWVQPKQAQRLIQGSTEWVHETWPKFSESVLYPPMTPPTGLDYTITNTQTLNLRWKAPAAVGITGYQIRGHYDVSAPLAIVKNDTGKIVEDPCIRKIIWKSGLSTYSHLFYAVAARTASGVGQLSTTLTVSPPALHVATWMTTAVPVYAAPSKERAVVGYLPLGDDRLYGIVGRQRQSPLWWQIRLVSGALGWVQDAAVTTQGDLGAVQKWPPQLRISSWTTLGLHLRSGPGTAYDPPLQTLTDRSVWYAITGKNAAVPTWWRIRLDTSAHGWVHASHVDTTGDLSGVSVQKADSLAPTDAGPAGEAATGTAHTSSTASGEFRNLANSWEGTWAVTKRGRTVTARFASTRSPVQWYARQHPQPQFVLPVGFRPTATVTHTTTGTHVHEDGRPYTGSPTARFDLTISTHGEMRYVNNRKVDHIGYLRYTVTHLQWQTDEILVEPAAPRAADISDAGAYLNQSEHRNSRWALARHDNTVTGSFSAASSPVEHYANVNRVAILRLPTDYRPTRTMRFQVTGARRVQRDGTDSGDTRRVNFELTVQPNGEMWYDRDTALRDAGVGYVRYTVNVSWVAASRTTAPSAPRNLHTDAVSANEVKLDWSPPDSTGGARIDEYRVEVYRNGRWRTEEDDIGPSRYTVEDLTPYTVYSWRARARNAAGWSEPSTALTVTTPRQAPGRPHHLAATAIHERVTLTWQAPVAGGAVTGYRIERRTPGGPWQTRTLNIGKTNRGWEDHTVTAATTYEYRVAAHNYGVAGDWSATRRVTTAAAPTLPGSPTGLTIEPGENSRLQLTWHAPTDTGGGITGYRVERSPDVTPRFWIEMVADTRNATLAWEDREMAADTVYHYRVSARNPAGMSNPSTAAQGRSRPQLRLAASAAYPLTAHAAPRADARVTATWATYLPGRSYDMAEQLAGPAGWWRILLFDAPDPGPFWLPMTAGTPWGATAAVPSFAELPGPVGAGAIQATGDRVTLTWQTPAAPGSHPVLHYRVRRRRASHGEAYAVVAARVTALQWTDSVPAVPGTWYYAVQAVSAAGAGPWSNPGPSHHVLVVGTLPGPVGTGMVQVTGDRVTLTWQAPATPGSHPVLHYRVRRRRASHDEAYAVVAVRVTALQWTESAPAVPGTWYYAVQAVSAVGAGPWSNPGPNRHVLVVPPA